MELGYSMGIGLEFDRWEETKAAAAEQSVNPPVKPLDGIIINNPIQYQLDTLKANISHLRESIDKLAFISNEITSLLKIRK